MTIKSAETAFGKIKAVAEVAAERTCLRCRATFWSHGIGERICSRCKGSAVWWSAIPEDSGQGRRRSGGGSAKV